MAKLNKEERKAIENIARCRMLADRIRRLSGMTSITLASTDNIPTVCLLGEFGYLEKEIKRGGVKITIEPYEAQPDSEIYHPRSWQPKQGRPYKAETDARDIHSQEQADDE